MFNFNCIYTILYFISLWLQQYSLYAYDSLVVPKEDIFGRTDSLKNIIIQLSLTQIFINIFTLVIVLIIFYKVFLVNFLCISVLIEN